MNKMHGWFLFILHPSSFILFFGRAGDTEGPRRVVRTAGASGGLVQE
jgi:hypothetical protein